MPDSFPQIVQSQAQEKGNIKNIEDIADSTLLLRA